MFPLKCLFYFISGSILIASITVIAEKKSPKIAGILMSLPVNTEVEQVTGSKRFSAGL